MKIRDALFVLALLAALPKPAFAEDAVVKLYTSAIEKNSTDDLKLAISKGADPYLCVSHGASAVKLAARGDCELLKYLIEKKIDLNQVA